MQKRPGDSSHLWGSQGHSTQSTPVALAEVAPGLRDCRHLDWEDMAGHCPTFELEGGLATAVLASAVYVATMPWLRDTCDC